MKRLKIRLSHDRTVVASALLLVFWVSSAVGQITPNPNPAGNTLSITSATTNAATFTSSGTVVIEAQLGNTGTVQNSGGTMKVKLGGSFANGIASFPQTSPSDAPVTGAILQNSVSVGLGLTSTFLNEIDSALYNLTGNSIINDGVGASFHNQALNNTSVNCSGTTACINTGMFNYGTLTNSNGASFSNESGAYLMNGAGGSLNNLSSATFSNSTGSVVDNLASSLTNGATLTNDGSGTTILNRTMIAPGPAGGYYSYAGPATLTNQAGGVLTNRNGATLTNDGIYATVNNSGTIVNDGAGTTFNNGLATDAANGFITAQNNTNSLIVNNNSGAKFMNQNGATVVNQSDAEFSNHGTFTNSATVTNSGYFFNHADGVLNNQAGATFNNTYSPASNSITLQGTLYNNGQINNAGTFILGPGSSLSGNGTYTQTGGKTLIAPSNPGTSIGFYQSTTNINGGVFGGIPGSTGTIYVNGQVYVGSGGTLAPGDPQSMQINGSLAVNGGTIDLQIAGSAPGQYDVLNVTGTASFTGGKIILDFIDGYAPKTGDSVLQLFNAAGGMSGLSNVTIDTEGLASGFDYQLQGTNSGSLSLVALNDASPSPVPLPATAWLMLSGLGGLAATLIRKRGRGAAVCLRYV